MALLHCQFHSETLMQACSMDVILPQATSSQQIGMSSAASRKRHGHPTLYLLHGLSDDHTIWQRRTSIERYVAPLGLAVVMPSVHRGFYTDMQHGYRYWSFVSEELPRLAQQFFNLSASRDDNFVAGLSMGGYGAMKLGLRCPEKFAAAASLSGALDVGRLLREPAKDAYRRREMADTFGSYRQFHNGDNDLLALAARLAKSGQRQPKLYVCCGTEDFLYKDNQTFRGHLAEVGLEMTYEEGPGVHEWGYWDRMIQRILEWLPIRKG